MNIEEAVEDLKEEGKKPLKLSYKKMLESELKENSILKMQIKRLEKELALEKKRVKTLEATIENLFNKL